MGWVWLLWPRFVCHLQPSKWLRSCRQTPQICNHSPPHLHQMMDLVLLNTHEQRQSMRGPVHGDGGQQSIRHRADTHAPRLAPALGRPSLGRPALQGGKTCTQGSGLLLQRMRHPSLKTCRGPGRSASVSAGKTNPNHHPKHTPGKPETPSIHPPQPKI